MTLDPAAPWPPVDLPVVDQRALETLRELADAASPDLVTEAARLFLGDADERMRQLERAIELAELESARRLSHTLKGASLVMGVCRLARACGGLESAAAASRADAAGVWWARVAIEYELATDALRTQMPRPEHG
ncbi:MAG TPA: Hpt domain-containing protein [Gemmatimonadales bacterium]|nr:Hpt domain-containing protein [Gemmatimonadales bacterium]